MNTLSPPAFLRHIALAAFIALALAGCKSSAERAADLVASGIVLEQAGDLDGAGRSYRSALDLDPANTDALRRLAGINLGREDYGKARPQYLALRERLPEDVEANLALAEIALADHDTDLAASYADVPRNSAPDNPRTRGILAALAYYAAAAAGDGDAREQALAEARTILRNAPGTMAARRILIQSLMSGDDPGTALPEIEAGLRENPGSLELNMMKLNVLSRQNGGTGAGEQLKAMYRAFPDNPDVQVWLRDWYLGEDDPDEIIPFLRDLAARHGDDLGEHDQIADYVVDNLNTVDAVDELDTLAGDYPPGPIADIYRARAAELRFFELGKRDDALATMHDIAGGKNAQKARPIYRFVFARMLDAKGHRADARAILDDVLAFDPNLAAAQKLRARWLIEDRDFSSAISSLRGALTSSSKDPELLTMIAEAYEQSGAVELAGSSLAQAVELSGNGVRESILFVRFLLRTDKRPVAVSVLRSALEAHPENPDLLDLAHEAGINLSPDIGE